MKMNEMPDREKVIRGLECCCVKPCPECEACPYANEIDGTCFTMDKMLRDALALMKAQEPDEDWISRKRLQDEIQYYIDEAGWGEEINKALGWCLEFIDNQEAVKWE